MPDLLPSQEEAIDNAKLAWFEANQKSWICPCGRVVEYAPEMAGDPCDHTAYCAGCVRDAVVRPGDDQWNDAPKHKWIALADNGKWVSLIIGGLGAQSYAAHVAAGTLR